MKEFTRPIIRIFKDKENMDLYLAKQIPYEAATRELEIKDATHCIELGDFHFRNKTIKHFIYASAFMKGAFMFRTINLETGEVKDQAYITYDQVCMWLNSVRKGYRKLFVYIYDPKTAVKEAAITRMEV